MGYQTNLVYWLANVIGNVGLAVAGLGYLTPFFPSLQDPLVMALAQIAVIWFFVYANILGPKIVGRMQGITTVIALFPIIGVALLGWFWFNPETYMQGWNVSGQSSLTAVGMTLNFTLWAFIGVESASVSTAVVKNPARNVPIATVVGVLLAAACYVLSSSAIMGIIPNKELIVSSAPFSEAVSVAMGPTAGKIVAVWCRRRLSRVVGRLDAPGGTNGPGGSQRRPVCQYLCPREPPRRSFGRISHCGGDYDFAGSGNHVSDRFPAVWQNSLNRRYYDFAAVYLFFSRHKNSRLRKNER